MPIRVLDPTVASQIAAGEVVERPASVVKELVENAIDAGASRVTVEVRGGGVTELRIQDDGSGIPPDEVEVAFQRHATSKLSTADDLFAIGTLGFRGEALPSIASVAQVVCVTRTASEPTGVELRIAGGELQARSSTGASPGTTFTIRNLFYNLPVRREFLRSPGAEAAAIGAVVTQYALAYPHVRFTLLLDGKVRLQTSGSGHLPDVLLSVYGLEVARAMLPVETDDGGELTRIAMRGLVSPPTLSRASRDAVHISVNGRAIAPRGQVAAILDDAYHTLLMKGRFPYAILGINVHPAAVDVNIHPTKSEVKFRDPDRIRAVLARAIRRVIQGAVVVQGWEGGTIAPPVEPHASLREQRPIWDAELDAERQLPPQALPPAALRPAVAEQAHEQLRPGSDQVVPPGPAARATPQPVIPAAHTTDRASEHVAAMPPAAPASQGAGQPVPEAGLAVAPASQHEPHPTQPGATEARLRPAIPPAEPIIPVATPGLPRLRALAQLARMYLLAEGPDGDLYLIDQHAAHERITYERLMAQYGSGAIDSQRLLMPQLVALPPATLATLATAQAELGTWGFEIEEEPRGVRVRAMPASIAMDELKPALIEVADHLSGAGGSTPQARREAMLVTLACHTSIRTGHPLTPAEQQALIDQLGRCVGPRTCPHGRPTVIVLTRQQLTRQFGRIQ